MAIAVDIKVDPNCANGENGSRESAAPLSVAELASKFGANLRSTHPVIDDMLAKSAADKGGSSQCPTWGKVAYSQYSRYSQQYTTKMP